MKTMSWRIVGTAAALGMVFGSGAALADGGSDDAHRCRHGGYQEVYRSDGTPFRNAGECSSYAARGGILATAATTELTDIRFSACNELTLGYVLDGVQHDVVTKPYGCNVVLAPDEIIDHVSTQTVVVFLRDETCSTTFDEAGSHAAVTGENPYQVAITDAGGECQYAQVDRRPTLTDPGNVNLTKTLS